MAKPRRKVLMLTRRYPPYNAVESTRPAAFAGHLRRFGWEPLVVCGHYDADNCPDRYDPDLMPESLDHVVCSLPPGDTRLMGEIAAEVRHGLRRQLSLSPRAWLTLPGRVGRFARKNAKDIALWAADNLLPELYPYAFTRSLMTRLPALIAQHRPDVILATSPPAGPHTAAAWASRKFSIPWVADFRDILEQDSVWKSRRTEGQRRWARARETRVARSAAAAVTVSAALAQTLGRRLRREVEVIPNGVDVGAYPASPPALDGDFTISYTGSVYIPQQDPGLLFAAIDRLLRAGKMQREHLSVKFYGCHAGVVDSIARGYECASCVQALPTVPRAACHRIQRSSQILLLLAVGREKGIYTGKVFEYLGARRPILCVPGDNDCVDALLAETHAGVSCPNVEAICRMLSDSYRAWLGTGQVPYRGRAEAIAKYSWARQAETLAEVLERARRLGLS